MVPIVQPTYAARASFDTSMVIMRLPPSLRRRQRPLEPPILSAPSGRGPGGAEEHAADGEDAAEIGRARGPLAEDEGRKREGRKRDEAREHSRRRGRNPRDARIPEYVGEGRGEQALVGEGEGLLRSDRPPLHFLSRGKDKIARKTKAIAITAALACAGLSMRRDFWTGR